MDALLALGYPNEFEIFEFLKYTQTAEIVSNNSVENIRSAFKKMREDGIIEKYDTNSKRYPHRYALRKNNPFCKVEPSILRSIDKNELIAQAIEVIETNETKHIRENIRLFPDQNRDIVIALNDNILLGVIDLRYYHHPKNEIRLPTRFYRQRNNQKLLHGMTELQYFSILVNEGSEFSKKKWLSVTCWG